MPINVFVNSSNNSESIIDTTLFVQKPYWGTKYIESHTKEDLEMKNQKKLTNLPDPISIRDAFSKNYVDKLFNDPNVLKKDTDIDFSDVNSKISNSFK